MSHHIIFAYKPPPPQTAAADSESVDAPVTTKLKELWITYPMIQYCTYRPSPRPSPHRSSIRLRCRDFTFVAFMFDSDDDAQKVYDGMKTMACIKRGRLDKLYAFSFKPHGVDKHVNGWNIYDPKKEFARLGISEGSTSKGWRITKINEDYKVRRLKTRLRALLTPLVLRYVPIGPCCTICHL
jgi:myotubularin-related protein 6/7/8